MKKLIAVAVGLMILLGFATAACGFWAERDMIDAPHVRKFLKVHLKLPHDTWKISKIWIDDRVAIVWVDYNADGRPDVAHIHSYGMEVDGIHYWLCHGDISLDAAQKYVDRWYYLNSA